MALCLTTIGRKFSSEKVAQAKKKRKKRANKCLLTVHHAPSHQRRNHHAFREAGQIVRHWTQPQRIMQAYKTLFFLLLLCSIGSNIKHLIDRSDETYCFRLHKDRVYYLRYANYINKAGQELTGKKIVRAWCA